MREIKFRAWDKKENKMYVVAEVRIGFARFDVDDSHNEAFVGTECRDAILMQYTGLKDKNGKEIFEGDIVAISEIVLINWDFIVSSPLLIEFRNYGWFPFAHGLPSPSELEIIGNIYQHPELLDKERA